MLDEAAAAALTGRPRDAFAPLDAVLGSSAAGPVTRLELARAGWLRGVALGASGAYAPAVSSLRGVRAQRGDDGELVAVRVAAAATAAALFRQIGDHASGERWERRGLDEADGWQSRHPGESAPDALVEAVLDCRIGHTADAVGSGLSELAAARLALAAATPAPRDGRRCSVRLAWVEAEVALLVGDGAQAVLASERALAVAAELGSPRHIAKSAMFVGVAGALRAGTGSFDAARRVLSRGAGIADANGLLPLVWPIRAVLATMPGMADDEAAAARDLELARHAVRAIAAGLPEPRRTRWFARDPMAGHLAEPRSG